MKNTIIFALCALFLVSYSSSEQNTETSPKTQGQQIFTAKVERIEWVDAQNSKTMLLENGLTYFLYYVGALLRDGDTVKYTKDGDGKVEKIVECIYNEKKNSLK